MKLIEAVRKALDRVVPRIAGWLFLICVLSTFLGIMNRTVGLKLNTSWVEEVSIFTMVWCTILLIGLLIRKGMHTQFTLLADKLKGKVFAVWRLIIMLIEAAVLVILLIGGVQLTANGSRMLMSALPLTMFWAYLSVPVGAALALLELAMMFIEESFALFGNERSTDR